MRLCIITPEYPPVTVPFAGGIGNQYAALAPELVRQGHEVQVFTHDARGSRLERNRGVDVHILSWRGGRVRRLLSGLGWPEAAAKAVSRRGPFDAVIAAEWGGLGVGYARRQHNGPLITQLHTSLAQVRALNGGEPDSLRARAGTALQLRRERRQTERSAVVTGVSAAVLEWASQLWRLDGIATAVLPNMVEVRRIRSLGSGEPPEGYPEREGPVVAFSGRLERRKGADQLLLAMREVLRAHPQATLVMLGSDVDGFGRRAAAASGLPPDRVRLLGNQPPERLFPALGRADVIALPSPWEAFGLAGLEAMALGRPVVLTSGSGFETFCRPERDGLMVPVGDVGALAAAIGRLLASEPLRRRLGAAAAARADEFDVEPMTRRHAEFYASVAPSRGRPVTSA